MLQTSKNILEKNIDSQSYRRLRAKNCLAETPLSLSCRRPNRRHQRGRAYHQLGLRSDRPLCLGHTHPHLALLHSLRLYVYLPHLHAGVLGGGRHHAGGRYRHLPHHGLGESTSDSPFRGLLCHLQPRHAGEGWTPGLRGLGRVAIFICIYNVPPLLSPGNY